MHRPLIRILVAALLAAGTPFACAQAFPAKPIRLICPFPPAGAVDIASRAIAAELARVLNQTVTVNPALYSKMPFDPNKDLVPIAALVSLSNVLVLHPSVKANSVAEVIAMIKAQPGKINYASSGAGTSIHMSGEMFQYLTKTSMTHIPYKGSGPAITDLLGGQVMMMFDNIPSALPHVRSGKLRALATTGAKRDPALPDLPTIAEAGVAGYESGVWFGLMAPAGTPKDVVARLNDASNKGLKAPEFVKRMGELGYVMMGGTPEHMTDLLKTEVARWTPIVKASGAKAD